MNLDELAKCIEEVAIEKDGVKRMPCAIAFGLAANYPVTLMEIGEACNRLGIKIVHCQLGCFE
jgi:hypothetical protein